MKEFTKLGRIECGLDDIVKGKVWAFTPGNHEGAVQLGVAIANERGFHPIPLTWCHAETYDEMWRHCDKLNEAEGLTKNVAMRIIASSHAAQNRLSAPHNPHMAGVELVIARELVKNIILAGYDITVNDGEEHVLLESRDQKAIVEALCSTEEDYLHVYQGGDCIGMIRLIYGNGTDLISDNTDNNAINAIVDPMLDWIEKQDFDKFDVQVC